MPDFVLFIQLQHSGYMLLVVSTFVLAYIQLVLLDFEKLSSGRRELSPSLESIQQHLQLETRSLSTE
jgi:hypothetical protein